MEQSVEKRMMADVPVGAFLSGGLDSSLTVGLMSRSVDRVKTFNITFDTSFEKDERHWARAVANSFGTEHHEIVIDEKMAFQAFEKIIGMQDEPIGDCVSIPIYCIANYAKQAGITVMLTGEGADELFCGYDTYAKYMAWDPWWRRSQTYIPASVRRWATDVVSVNQKKVPARVALCKAWAEGQELFWSGATAFYDAWKDEICYADSFSDAIDPIVTALSPGLAQAGTGATCVEYRYKELTQHNPTASSFNHILYRELTHRLPELLLTRFDKMTMMAGIEGRVPFLDPQLVAYALTIPQQLQIQNGITKYVLKKACETILPPDIIYRKKIGFAAPVTHWFKKGTYFKPYFKELISNARQNHWCDLLNSAALEKLCHTHEKGDADFGYQLWVLQNILATDGTL
jgi:asparagine synthase (glutamine-hydrolysing)